MIVSIQRMCMVVALGCSFGFFIVEAQHHETTDGTATSARQELRAHFSGRQPMGETRLRSIVAADAGLATEEFLRSAWAAAGVDAGFESAANPVALVLSGAIGESWPSELASLRFEDGSAEKVRTARAVLDKNLPWVGDAGSIELDFATSFQPAMVEDALHTLGTLDHEILVAIGMLRLNELKAEWATTAREDPAAYGALEAALDQTSQHSGVSHSRWLRTRLVLLKRQVATDERGGSRWKAVLDPDCGAQRRQDHDLDSQLELDRVENELRLGSYSLGAGTLRDLRAGFDRNSGTLPRNRLRWCQLALRFGLGAWDLTLADRVQQDLALLLEDSGGLHQFSLRAEQSMASALSASIRGEKQLSSRILEELRTRLEAATRLARGSRDLPAEAIVLQQQVLLDLGKNKDAAEIALSVVSAGVHVSRLPPCVSLHPALADGKLDELQDFAYEAVQATLASGRGREFDHWGFEFARILYAEFRHAKDPPEEGLTGLLSLLRQLTLKQQTIQILNVDDASARRLAERQRARRELLLEVAWFLAERRAGTAIDRDLQIDLLWSTDAVLQGAMLVHLLSENLAKLEDLGPGQERIAKLVITQFARSEDVDPTLENRGAALLALALQGADSRQSTARLQYTDKSLRKLLAPGEHVLFVLPGSQAVRLMHLEPNGDMHASSVPCTSTELDALIDTVVAGLGSSGQETGPSDEFHRDLRRLSDVLVPVTLRKVADREATAGLLVIAPDPVASMPYEMLLLPSTLATASWRELPFVVGAFDVRRAPSLAVLKETRQLAGSRRHAAELAAGAWIGKDHRSTGAIVSTPIPGAVELFSALQSAFGKEQVRLSPTAGEAAFRQALAGATHSILVVFAHGVAGARGQYLLLDAGDEQDGLLGFDELASRSSSCNLLVLCACNSALGQDALQGSELPLGLPYACMKSGVTAIIAGQRELPSQASARILADLVSSRGRSAVGALAAAKRNMLQSPIYCHPRNWTGLVYLGDLTTLDWK